MSWRRCLVLGAIGFVIFYWLLPGWLEHYIASQEGHRFHPMLDAMFGRRIRLLKVAGLGITLVCLFFAVRNYYTQRRMASSGVAATGFIARLLARMLD